MDRFFYHLESLCKRQMTREGFLRVAAGGLAVFLSQNAFLKWAFAKKGESSGRIKKGIKGTHDLVVADGTDPYRNTVQAVEAMGGMGRFVKKGETVVVKPNMAWDRTPEQAANTDPRVVAAVVELCYKAGAKRVNVFDVPCNDERRVYENSGIEKAAREAGARVYFADHWNVVKARFPYPSPMEDWPILRDAVVCDTFINVPVLKSHGLTKLTLSMKNLMGVCSGTRGRMHFGIGRNLADLTDFIAPDLTVIDATRVLMRHGPSGGNLADVAQVNKLIVATDPVLADSFAAGMIKVDPRTIPYIKEAAIRKLGNPDISKADILRIQV